MSLHEIINVISRTAEGHLSAANCANGFYALGKLVGHNRRHEPSLETKALVKKLVTSASYRAFNRNQTLKIYYGVATGRLDLLDERLPRLLKTLIDVGVRQTKDALHDMSAQQITNLMMSLAKLEKPPQLPTPSSIVMSAIKGGGQRSDYISLVRSLAGEIYTRGLKDFNSRDISTMMWSLAAIGDPQGSEEKQVCDLVAKEICMRGFKGFAPQGISSLLWSFATLEFCHEEFLDTVCKEISSQGLKQFNEQDITNVIWSLAKLGRYDAVLCRMILDEVYSRGLGNFNSQGVTNLLSSFVKLGMSVTTAADEKSDAGGALSQDGPRFFGMISDEINRRGLRPFSHQAIASVAWSFGTAGSKDDRIFDRISQEILDRGLRDFSAQHISNLVLGYAKSGKSNQLVFESISRHIARGSSRQLKEFTSQGISNLLWSFAKVEWFDEELIEVMVDEVCNRKLHDFTSQAISTIIWAIAKVGRYFDARFLGLVVDEVKLRGMKDFDGQHISNLLWSLATFGVNDPGFLELIPEAIEEKLPESSFQSIVNISWSLVCLDVLDTPAARRFFDLTLPSTIQVEYIKEVALQLHQCKVAWMQTHPDQPLPRLLKGLIGDGEWIEQAVNERNEMNESSSSHLEVASVLHELGFTDLTNEFITENGISVDVLLRTNVKHPAKVAIEVDGPFHFMSDGSTPTGATMFKRRLLEREGYQVYSINVTKEWRNLRSREDQRQYLLRLLRSELNITTSE